MTDMTANDVVAALDALEAASIWVTVEGGWGVDALIGHQTRPHRDVDLAGRREDVDGVAEALAALGYRHDHDAQPGLPTRLVLTASEGRQVDFHPLEQDEDGGWFLPLPDGTRSAHPETLIAARGTIGDREVSCIAAELQIRFHSGYVWSAHDAHDMQILATLHPTTGAEGSPEEP